MGVLVGQVLDGLGGQVDAQAGGVVVHAAGDADGAHAGVQVVPGGPLVHQHVGGHGEDDAVGALSLAVLGHLNGALGGGGGGAEEHGDLAPGHGHHLFDDGLLLLHGEQGGLTGGAQHEDLAGAVLDLAVDQGLKAVEVDLVVGGKGGGHGHKGAFQLNHNKFLLKK